MSVYTTHLILYVVISPSTSQEINKRKTPYTGFSATKTIQLPFIPQPGVSIALCEEGIEFFGDYTASKVCWNHPDGDISCFSEHHRESHDDLHDEFDYYKDRGWDVDPMGRFQP
jgi:hypothetical protein